MSGRMARRVPRGALACALVAVLNAAVWAVVTPPFHVPDEPQHVAYVQYLAETGRLPRPVPGAVFSAEEAAAVGGVGFDRVVGNRGGRPPWASVADAELQRELSGRPLSRRSQGALSNTTNNPPLFYALETIPYAVGSGGTLLDRLLYMRLLSALLAGVTVLFVFLFARELVPGSPWAWPAAALAVAFQPMFGFVSGGVNNDSLLYAAAAATFFLLARILRGGLDPRRGAALGAAVGLGLVAKATMVGLLPAFGVALALATLRAGPGRRAAALRGAGAALLVAAVPVLAYVALNVTVFDRPLWAGAGGSAPATNALHKGYNFRELLSYLWQFYLPRLPFQQPQFTYYPLWETWFRGFVGRFGWLDYDFVAWVYQVALYVYLLIVGLALSALGARRRALARRWPELLTYLVAVAGLVALIAVAGYRGRIDSGYVFEQARYLLPLLALYGGIIALAVRAAGRKWGPAVGAGVVVLALAHGLFAQLLTIARYYG